MLYALAISLYERFFKCVCVLTRGEFISWRLFLRELAESSDSGEHGRGERGREKVGLRFPERDDRAFLHCVEKYTR